MRLTRKAASRLVFGPQRLTNSSSERGGKRDSKDLLENRFQFSATAMIKKMPIAKLIVENIAM